MNMFLITIVLSSRLVLPTIVESQGSKTEASRELDAILKSMAAHDEWQSQQLVEYQVERTFFGANRRFNKESTLEVQTSFRKPNKFESNVTKSEGSTLIREHVFDKILDAEKETQVKETRETVNITPVNYLFTLIGREDCEGRACHHLKIVPRKKSKYALEGEIWVDVDDGAIVRIQGSPAKRPSIWTRETNIERRYRRFDGIWLCETMESTSDILIAGKSTLKVDYKYVAVRTAERAN